MTSVSILIVSYNVRQYVAHAIDAILKSDMEEMEIIVVDNNSYDNTVAYLQDRYHHLHQIKIIENSDNPKINVPSANTNKIAALFN